MVKAVLFDMDGTFVDSEHLHKEAETLQCRQYGIELTQEDKDIFAYIIDKYSLKDRTIDQLIEENNAIYMDVAGPKIKLYDGFTDLTAMIKPKKMGLVTSSNSQVQKFVFKTLALDGIFDEIVTVDMVSKGKPHPAPYQLCLRKLNMSPLDVIALEDSVNGILSAKTAGILTLAIGHTLPKERLLHSAHYAADLKAAKVFLERYLR